MNINDALKEAQSEPQMPLVVEVIKYDPDVQAGVNWLKTGSVVEAAGVATSNRFLQAAGFIMWIEAGRKINRGIREVVKELPGHN